MSEYYTDYVWRNGIPYGICKISEPLGSFYKLPMDPYRKRIAIEYYEEAYFKRLIYDSALLDFRHLKLPAEQTAWQKEVTFSSSEEIVSHLRNQDDRLVCIERCHFQGAICVECAIYSPSNLLLSTHRMFYRSLGAPFDGVILYDSNDHIVMRKTYEVEPESGEFMQLIEEKWECAPLDG